MAPPPYPFPPAPLFHRYARPATHRKTEKERQLADGRGAKSYDGEMAWSSMNLHYFLGSIQDLRQQEGVLVSIPVNLWIAFFLMNRRRLLYLSRQIKI